MAERFDILYRFSTDNGATWTDVSEQVNSLQTNIAQNLCTNTFLSAKDEATFVLPETPLFKSDGVTPTPKKLLIDAILGNDQVLVHINERKPASQVLWDDNDVLWNGNHVVWSWSSRRFTGYVDKSSVSLRSYPLPPNLTVRLQDVSVLHLDDKVDTDICWETDEEAVPAVVYTVKRIVRELLGLAGYDNTDPSLSDADTTVMSSTDNVVIPAFVIDRDKAKTYRQYIDTLLFEAGGYVINFNEYGIPVLVHLQWDGSAAAQRVADNPMNANGVTMRSAYLVNDGAKVKWSTLQWAQNERIWQSNINQKYEDGILVGDIVHDMGYWPPDGDVSPIFFQYDAKLLDIPYLHRDTRWQNEDLSIIMAKNTRLGVDTLKGTTPFPIEDWDKHDPNSWPVGDTWHDKYGLDSNPQYWPTKMWILLQNKTGEDLNVSLAYIYGDVLYRSRINTMQTDGSKNPKEYVSEYIYDKDQAERFLQFYWHFLQTSRYQFSWSEPNVHDSLNDIVEVGIKGNSSMQKSLVVGKSSQWLNASTEIITYTSVGIETYVPSQLIPTIIAPSSSQTPVPSTKNAITATFATTPSFTLAEWETFGTAGVQQSWTITNDSAFAVGDIARINGVISDMEDTPVSLYMDVTGVDTVNHVITGTGIRIEYTYVNAVWDFEMSQDTVTTDKRLSYWSTKPYTFTAISLTAIKTGYETILPKWSCTGSKAFFGNPGTQTTSGDTATLIIPKDETAELVQVTMTDYYNPGTPTITKGIATVDQTEYDHDFGAWTPTDDGSNVYILPDHITKGTEVYDVIDGDFFVSKGFSTGGTQVGSPTGNPHENGYYERGGAGTGHRPYFYFLSADTTVDALKTYYTPSGTDYPEGIPYVFENGSQWNQMTANQANSHRLLASLGNVMNSGIAVPSTAALWGWFQNLVAQNAIIKNLTAINLNVGTYGTGFSFRALTDDGNGNKVFDVTYNGADLFKVDIATGKIYFGQGFWYDPDDQAIHSFNDNVVIDSMGVITAQQATFNNALIQGNSEFQGSFDCDVIKTVGFQNVIATCSSTTHSRAQVKEIVEYAISQGFEADRNYEAELYLGGTQYASVKAAGFKKTTSANYDRYSITLIDSSYNAIDMKSFPYAYVAFVTGSDPNRKQWAYMYPNDSFEYNYFKVDVTLKLKKGKNVLQLDIPSHLDVASLSAGQMFYGPQTTVGAPCYPLYIKA